MSRFVLPAAVLVLLPAGARAQLPFYFSEVPGNPAVGYRAYDANPLGLPPVVYQPLTGPGVGPFFAPTLYNGYVGNAYSYPTGYPMYAAGYYPTFGTPGYVPPLSFTVVVIDPPAAPAAAAAGPVPVGMRSAAPAPAATPTGNVATLTFQFPAAAKVWLDGKTAAGPETAERTLTSPPLRPGEKYTFKVKAEWEANGATHTYTRDTTLTAGEQVRATILGGK